MNWKIALVVATLASVSGAFGALGCGGDDCTRADDHYAECSLTQSSTSSTGGMQMTEACSGVRLCHSQCINQHTCAQITGNDPAYTQCITDCNGK